MCITLVNSLGSAHPPGAPEFTSVILRLVLRNLQLYVWSFVDCCLSFCPFSIEMYVVSQSTPLYMYAFAEIAMNLCCTDAILEL